MLWLALEDQKAFCSDGVASLFTEYVHLSAERWTALSVRWTFDQQPSGYGAIVPVLLLGEVSRQ